MNSRTRKKRRAERIERAYEQAHFGPIARALFEAGVMVEEQETIFKLADLNQKLKDASRREDWEEIKTLREGIDSLRESLGLRRIWSQ